MSEDHIRVVGQVDEHGPRHVGLTDPVRPLAEGVRQQIHVHLSDYWPLEPPLMVTRAERVWMQEVADRYEQVQRGGFCPDGSSLPLASRVERDLA